MTELTFDSAPQVSFTPPAISLSWRRVLLASACLASMSFLVEHDTTQAARNLAAQDEAAILDANLEGTEEGSRTRAAVLLLYAGVGVVLMMTSRHTPWNPHRLGLTLIVLLTIWAAMTVTWASIPSLSLRRLIAWLCFVAGSFGLARALTPREVLRMAFLSLAVLISISLLCDLSAGAKPWQSGYRFGGTLHQNVQATYCATLCLAAYCLTYERRTSKFFIAALAGGLLLLFLTGSRTGLVAALLAMGSVWMMKKSGAAWAFAMGGIITLVGLIMISLSVISPAEMRSLTGAALLGRTEKAESLTGRVPLWEELGGYAADRPIRGYGYDSFWTPEVMESLLASQKWSMTSAHNIYLEAVLQIGLVGMLLTLAATLLCLLLAKKWFDRTSSPAYQFIFGLLVYAMLNGLLEAHFFRPKLTTALALMGAASLLLFRPYTEDQEDEQPHATPTLRGAEA